jgi:hypothetical protein
MVRSAAWAVQPSIAKAKIKRTLSRASVFMATIVTEGTNMLCQRVSDVCEMIGIGHTFVRVLQECSASPCLPPLQAFPHCQCDILYPLFEGKWRVKDVGFQSRT